jgi:hypothetical protein
MTTTEHHHQEYQTQVYHVASMTVQNEYQYPPDSPRAVAGAASASPRSKVVSPSGSPRSIRRANANANANNNTNNGAAITSVISTSFDGDDDYIDSLKSSREVYMERGANLRALALLNTEVTGNGNGGNGNDGINKPTPVSALTARKAAILKYEQQQKEKYALALALETIQLQSGDSESTYAAKRAASSLVLAHASRQNTKLAETTRKVKKVVLSKEDEGIDRIADMKCQLDLDREKEAMHKALRLLNHGFMY